MAGSSASGLMADAAGSLFSPVLDGAVVLRSGARVLYMNGYACDAASEALQGRAVDVVQPFYAYAHGFSDAARLVDAPDGVYDGVFILWPKNAVEGQYYLALALQHVRGGGVVAVAAGNKAGGGRLAKVMQRFGAQDVFSVSANKCRCVYAFGFDGAADVIEQAFQAGGRQSVLDGAFQSQAGVYGWDKVDVGSALLIDQLPDVIKGRRGADFGCGYGYLTRTVLQRLQPPYKFYGIDADKRAVDLCALNGAVDGIIEPLWADILCPDLLPQNLDFIVMNPPFHEGKKADSGIGRSFIASAARCLRDGGRLWMVANSHLPYERDLRGLFRQCETVFVGQGFKVFECVKLPSAG